MEVNVHSNSLEVRNWNVMEFRGSSNNEIELMPLNSPQDSPEKPDIIVSAGQYDENSSSKEVKKRKATPVITLNLSKKKTHEGHDTSSEKDGVKLDEETKQVKYNDVNCISWEVFMYIYIYIYILLKRSTNL